VSFFLLLPPLAAWAYTTISLGQAGPESIKYNGVEYARPGGCQAATISFGGAPSSAGQFRTNISGDTVIRNYKWGSIRCHYSVSGDEIKIDVYVANTTQNPIHEVTMGLATLDMPMPAKEGGRITNTKLNLEGPDILALSRGNTTLLVANEEVGRLEYLRFQQGPRGSIFIILDTLFQAMLPARRVTVQENQLRPMVVARPIPTGQSDHYSVALAFLHGGESPRSVLGDLFDRVAARFPPTLSWPDRRPIGQLMLSSHGRSSPFDPRNPRYWRFRPSADVTSPAGRAEFETWLLTEADKTVKILKQMNAQGVIVWDIDGQQYPHPISYGGEPRRIPPEMQGVVDKLFKRFTDAGLRCGVNAGGRRFSIAADGRASQDFIDDPNGMFQMIDEKIRYVEKRWGCTLFYIDAPGGPRWPADASVFRRLAANHPNALLSPEHTTIIDYAWIAGIWGTRHGPSPSSEARWVYPRAFSIITTSAMSLGRGSTTWQDLVQNVRDGDVLMFASWVSTPQSQAVAQIYQDALGPDWREAAVRR